MLYNHGWEKQQTQRPKDSGPERVRQAKKPTKRNPATGQKDHFKGWTKNGVGHKYTARST